MILNLSKYRYKIENGNGEWSNRQQPDQRDNNLTKERTQPNATILSSMQRENPTPGGALHLTPKEMHIVVQC